MAALITTGTLARQWSISRERILQVLSEAGIRPSRDTSGRRLLTEKDVRELEHFRQNRLRRTPRAD